MFTAMTEVQREHLSLTKAHLIEAHKQAFGFLAVTHGRFKGWLHDRGERVYHSADHMVHAVAYGALWLGHHELYQHLGFLMMVTALVAWWVFHE